MQITYKYIYNTSWSSSKDRGEDCGGFETPGLKVARSRVCQCAFVPSRASGDLSAGKWKLFSFRF